MAVAHSSQDADAIVREDVARVAGALGELLARLAGKRLFLTGGTGFFGKWLLEVLRFLNAQGRPPCRVTALTRDPRAFASAYPHLAGAPHVTPVAGDVRTFGFPEGGCDLVIHGATPASARLLAEDPLEMAEVITAGTRRVLEYAAGAGVERFLFVSSGAVYGPQPPDVSHVPEEFAGGPDVTSARSAYAEGKRYAELLCAIAREKRGVPVVTARPFAFVGPYQDLNGVFAATDFIRDALAGGPIRIGGDGTPLRSYMYAADLAEALLRVLLDGRAGRAYNVGSAEPVSIADLARRVAGQFDPAPVVTIAGQPTPGRPPERYVPDVSRAEAELGIRIRVGLDEALARAVAWHRARAPHHVVSRNTA